MKKLLCLLICLCLLSGSVVFAAEDGDLAARMDDFIDENDLTRTILPFIIIILPRKRSIPSMRQPFCLRARPGSCRCICIIMSRRLTGLSLRPRKIRCLSIPSAI